MMTMTRQKLRRNGQDGTVDISRLAKYSYSLDELLNRKKWLMNRRVMKTRATGAQNALPSSEIVQNALNLLGA